MNRWIIWTTVMAAALPVKAGVLLTLDSTVSTPTIVSLASFPAGATLYISAGGTVNLNGPVGNPSGLIVTNPDGSLSSFPPASCSACWAPGYEYFLPASLGGTPYPTTFGGDSINHFVGGGANFDKFPGMHPAFAAQGKPTTDTLDPLALRFGAIAGTFVTNPAPTDWFLAVGTGHVIPNGATNLQLVVVDTFYSNNSGSYTVFIDTTPEPAVGWLALSGIGFLAWRRYRTRHAELRQTEPRP
jgi:hypothetical protein